MTDATYSKICDEGCDFENLLLPLLNGDVELIRIDGTENGDGSTRYEGYDIGVDSEMLCVAKIPNPVENIPFVINNKPFNGLGAFFKTLEEALEAYPKILRQF